MPHKKHPNYPQSKDQFHGVIENLLRRLPAIDPTDTAALEALLPDRWVAAHPEHRLEQREEESREAQARRRRKRIARRAAASQVTATL
jgi:hypothetical protein